MANWFDTPSQLSETFVDNLERLCPGPGPKKAIFWHSSPMLNFEAKPCSSVKSWLLMNEVETIWLKPAHLGPPVILRCNQLYSRPDMYKACEEFNSTVILPVFLIFWWHFDFTLSTMHIFLPHLNLTNLDANHLAQIKKYKCILTIFMCFFHVCSQRAKFESCDKISSSSCNLD